MNDIEQIGKIFYFWVVAPAGYFFLARACYWIVKFCQIGVKLMRKYLAALSILALAASFASAQMSDEFNPSKGVIRSSATIHIVLISSSAPTLVDTPQIAGSFVVEVQNRDASSNICCAFDPAFTTSIASEQGKGCRQVSSGGGTWVVSRWWQNLRLYCQTLSTSGTSPVAVTQGR